MNERTKQLAEQARKYYLTLPTGYKPEHVGMYRELMEKFAELIVKECAELADEPTSRPFESYGEKIKKHFGVE